MRLGPRRKVSNIDRPAGARNKFLREKKARKRSEAEARQAEYSALSAEEKIARISTRRGASFFELFKVMEPVS